MIGASKTFVRRRVQAQQVGVDAPKSFSPCWARRVLGVQEENNGSRNEGRKDTGNTQHSAPKMTDSGECAYARPEQVPLEVQHAIISLHVLGLLGTLGML